MPRASRTARILRSLTALVTVWCLGCSGYDPLLDALVPGADGTMMQCESEGDSSIAGDVFSQTGERFLRDASSGSSSEEGATCGCDSCHAPAVAAFAIAPAPTAVPFQPSADPGVPPSVNRTPLVPPPQAVA